MGCVYSRYLTREGGDDVLVSLGCWKFNGVSAFFFGDDDVENQSVELNGDTRCDLKHCFLISFILFGEFNRDVEKGGKLWNLIEGFYT